MLQLARAVGIKTADAGLIPVGEIDRLPHIFQGSKANALWVKRFDREDNRRIHMEDFNQLYGQYPEGKYDRYTYSNMARDYSPPWMAPPPFGFRLSFTAEMRSCSAPKYRLRGLNRRMT